MINPNGLFPLLKYRNQLRMMLQYLTRTRELACISVFPGKISMTFLLMTILDKKFHTKLHHLANHYTSLKLGNWLHPANHHKATRPMRNANLEDMVYLLRICYHY